MNAAGASGFLSELRLRGHAVLPAPRQATLRPGEAQLGPGWSLTLHDVAVDDMAVRTLVDALAESRGWQLTPRTIGQGGNDRPAGGGEIRLAIRDETVKLDADPMCRPQAYRLLVEPTRVHVTGNGPAGLFYGVQTLLQLLACGDAPLTLPLGQIDDWPSYPLRITHWDSKHHQDRPETLRRYIDELASFKANAVAFELEDKFAYPSHPRIAAPGAFSPAQLQSLVDYALARHVQIIPMIQAPAHMAYVLKHDEFAHLRCDGSNYMICMEEPEAVRLIFDLYDDVLAATRGVEYFLVSTDEVYYAGICEKHRPYTPDSRAKTWCEFANRANAYLRERGRRTIMWIEWPLRAGDVAMLSPDIIDGVIGTDDVDAQLAIENQRGMRQLAYVSMQGAEPLFPNYFAMAGGSPAAGRLAEAFDATRAGKATRGRPIGTFAAAWDDSGLHNETFWPGWAMMAQCGWTPGGVTVAQTLADFITLFYGGRTCGMADVLRDLQSQARFWESSWQRVVSAERPHAYGNSERKFPYPRRDRTLPPPALPSLPDLTVQPRFAPAAAAALAELPSRVAESDRLIARLHENIGLARRNRYNLHVLLSIASFVRHHLDLLAGCRDIELVLARAAEAHQAGRPDEAINRLHRAYAAAGAIIADRDDVFARLTAVWEQSRFPKGRSAEGRSFLHVLDDVKDHDADRRADLSYLIAPEQRIGLEQWRDELTGIIHRYAVAHGVVAKVESPHE